MTSLKEARVKVERLHGGKPIVCSIESHPWESKVTFNPACILVQKSDGLGPIVDALPFDGGTKAKLAEHEALCFLLYRAQGRKEEGLNGSPSSLGLAVLSPELELLARHPEPVLLPDKPFDNLGVEDARITKLGGKYFLVYTAYASGSPGNKIRIAVATTADFVHWEKQGLLKGDFNIINNKNGILFGDQPGGKYIMLHRPMEGTDAMTIHWAEAAHPLGKWTSRGVLMQPVENPAFTETWLGGGAPPLKIPEGYLMLYHIGNRAEDGTREYDLGIALLKWTVGGLTVLRSGLLMRPETEAETTGDEELGVNNVVFICGAYLYKGDCYFPYAGADSVVLAAKIPRRELDRFVAK
jgi:predicted GH43/DUF377 family glycosyl hydrolase